MRCHWAKSLPEDLAFKRMPPDTRTAGHVGHISRPRFNPGESLPGYLLRIAADNFINGIAALARVHAVSAQVLVSMDPQNLALRLWGPKSEERLDLGHLKAARRINARAHLWRSQCRICPDCWKEGPHESYFRDEWDEIASMVCGKHRVMLVDRCPSCHEPLDYRSLLSPVRCTCGQVLSASVTQRPSRTAKRALQALGLFIQRPGQDAQLLAARAIRSMNLVAGHRKPREIVIQPERAFVSALQLKAVAPWFADWPRGFVEEFVKRGWKPKDIVGFDLKGRFCAHELSDINLALNEILAKNFPSEGSHQRSSGLSPYPISALFSAFPRRDNHRAAIFSAEELDGPLPKGSWPTLLLAVYGAAWGRSGVPAALDVTQLRDFLRAADPEGSGPSRHYLSATTSHLLKVQRLLTTTRIRLLKSRRTASLSEPAVVEVDAVSARARQGPGAAESALAPGTTLMQWVATLFAQRTVEINIGVMWRLTSCRLAIDCYLWLRVEAASQSALVNATWTDFQAQVGSESPQESFRSGAARAWSMVMEVCPNITVIPVHDGFVVEVAPKFHVEGC